MVSLLSVGSNSDVNEILGSSVVSKESINLALRSVTSESTATATAVSVIKKLYIKAGYPLVVISDIEFVDNHWFVKIVEGKVRSIRVTGSKKTTEHAVLAFMDSKIGGPYHEPTAKLDRNRLAALGAFADVIISPAAISDLNSNAIGDVDLKVVLKDTQTGNIAATIGYGDFTGFTGFVSLSDNNLFRRLDRGQINWQRWSYITMDEFGQFVQQPARQAFSFNYGRPIAKRKSTGFDVAGYDQNTLFLPTFSNNVQTIRNYEQRTGGTVKFGTRFAAVESWLGYRQDNVGLAGAPSNLGATLDELAAAKASVHALRLSFGNDQRSHSDSATKGFYWSAATEVASPMLGSSVGFNKTDVDLRQYFPISKTKGPKAPIFAVRTYLGQITGSAPLTEQFYLGGFDLLRGYDLYSIRGKSMLLQSAELRVPISEGVAGAVFVDYGGASKSSQLSGVDYKLGYGAGLRFVTPFGPIKLDFAYGSRLQTYVSLGQSF